MSLIDPDTRRPVADADDLDTLDGAEIVEGYQDGRENLPCGDNRSRAYWHGWRNGRVDAGHAEKDWHQALLARNVAQRERLRAVLASGPSTPPEAA